MLSLSFDKQVLHLRLLERHFWRTVANAAEFALEQADGEAAALRYGSMVDMYQKRITAAATAVERSKIQAEFCAHSVAFARQQFDKKEPVSRLR